VKLNKEEKEEFALRYLPLVKYVVSRFYIREGNIITKEDLFHWGVIGLMESIERFDKNKGVKFEVYAVKRITGAIKDALRREDTFTRTQREKIKRVTSAIDSLGEDFSEEAIASKLGIDLSSYQTLLEEISPVITTSVEELLEEKGLEIADNRDTIEDKIIEDETRELLAKAIKRLTDKEKQILNLYYYEGLTLKQIGGILGLTESRVSQLHSQIRLKLRGFIKNE